MVLMYFWDQLTSNQVSETELAQICDCQGRKTLWSVFKVPTKRYGLILVNAWISSISLFFQSLEYYLSSTAIASAVSVAFTPSFEKLPFNCLPTSALRVSGGSLRKKKSKLSPYVPADLLIKCEMLPCCSLPGWKIGRRDLSVKEEEAIKNCRCWRQ